MYYHNDNIAFLRGGYILRISVIAQTNHRFVWDIQYMKHEGSLYRLFI